MTDTKAELIIQKICDWSGCGEKCKNSRCLTDTKLLDQQIADLWKGYVKLADDQTKPRVPAFPDESSMGESITWTAQYVYQLAQKEMLKAGFRKVIL
jgi:hypothetical protein